MTTEELNQKLRELLNDKEYAKSIERSNPPDTLNNLKIKYERNN